MVPNGRCAAGRGCRLLFAVRLCGAAVSGGMAEEAGGGVRHLPSGGGDCAGRLHGRAGRGRGLGCPDGGQGAPAHTGVWASGSPDRHFRIAGAGLVGCGPGVVRLPARRPAGAGIGWRRRTVTLLFVRHLCGARRAHRRHGRHPAAAFQIRGVRRSASGPPHRTAVRHQHGRRGARGLGGRVSAAALAGIARRPGRRRRSQRRGVSGGGLSGAGRRSAVGGDGEGRARQAGFR